MKTAFLYAGQGSQFVGMGKDFYENYESFREIAGLAELDFDALKLMFEGPDEELRQTEYTQPCMAIFAAGLTKLLGNAGIKPDGALGLSLGEYGALHAAGVMDAKSYIKAVAFRGSVMAEAARQYTCSMSAILGLSSSAVEACCEKASSEGFVTVANYNCPKQYVICGDEKAVAAAEGYASEEGALRCVRLNVSAPFHTKYLEPAGEKLYAYLEGVELAKPEIPVALNVTGKMHAGEDLKQLLKQQVYSSVRFENCLEAFLADGYTRFIEIGPGNALSGFCKKKAREMGLKVEIINLQTAEDFEKLISK